MKILGLLLISPFLGVFITAVTWEIVDAITKRKTKPHVMQGSCLVTTMFIAGLLLILFTK